MGRNQVWKIRPKKVFLNLKNLKSPKFWLFGFFFICCAVNDTNQIELHTLIVIFDFWCAVTSRHSFNKKTM